MFSPLNDAIKQMKKQLGPMIQERLDQEKEHDDGGDWSGKPVRRFVCLLPQDSDCRCNYTIFGLGRTI